LKGSLCGSGQRTWASFEKETQRFFCSKLHPKQQNLWETVEFSETAKSQFERGCKKSLGLFPKKGTQKAALIRRGCPSRAAYYFKIW